ncbi:MAG TPA: TIR domain-containing protein [Opitutaceae bacterium]|nr:TIR domain-containing protein [Opitutaceae bacterium]
MSDPGKAVFLSYASQDAEAARRIADALRTAGVEVWFDQSELRGGDAWDAAIRKQIRECALFVPIVSANTQSRAEGYFRLEWRLAVERSHLMADDAPFLFPIVIGEVSDAAARVPDKFREVQWTRLRQAYGGQARLEGDDPEWRSFAERVAKLLSGEVRPSFAKASEGGASQPRKRGFEKWWWLIFAIMGMSVPFIGVFKSKAPRSEGPQLPQAAAPAVSNADELVAKAHDIMERGSLRRSEIDAANSLLERAMEIDPSNARAWSLAANADLAMIFPYRYNTSDAMRQRAMARASRALSLAPEVLEVQVVHANVFAHASNNPVYIRQAETLFRRLVAEHPEMHFLVIRLADILRADGRMAEGARYLEENGEPILAGWFWLENGSLDESYRVARSPAAQASTHVDKWLLKLTIESSWLQDLDLAWKTIGEMPPELLTGDNPTVFTTLIAFSRREPNRMLQFTASFSRDWIESYNFAGPKQYWTGWAHELAGRPERARIEWQGALRLIEDALETSPGRLEFGYQKATLLALLGETDAARKVLAEFQAFAGVAPGSVDFASHEAWLALGENNRVFEWMDPFLRYKSNFQWIYLHWRARFLPQWDALRGDPRFGSLLRETKPDSAKPFD